MQIECFNFAKEPNSTKVPLVAGRAVNCVLKDDCSLMQPVFLLNSWQLTDNYLKWGSRYYWIEDIVIKTKNHAEYHCREDVLGTFKAYIGSSSQYIVRSSYSYTGTLIDSKYPAKCAVTKHQKELTTLHASVYPSGSTGFYVVGIQNGGSAETGGVAYYALSGAEFQAFLNYMYGGTWLDTSGANVTVALQKELINPMQYVSSIVWFPFSITDISGSSAQLKFGWWAGTTGVNGKRIAAGSFIITFTETLTLHRHPDANSRGTYLNGLPFTRYTLFCYGFGQVPIDANLFTENGSIVVSITVDVSTGDAKLQIVANEGNGPVMMVLPGKMGQEIQISQLSQSLLSPVSNILGGAVGLSYGNAVGFAQGITSAIESMMPQQSVRGSTGSRMWYNRTPEIIAEHRLLANEDKDHIGRPLCVRGTISSYPGYIEVENADIDFACNFTELESIKAFMESGFYYE